MSPAETRFATDADGLIEEADAAFPRLARAAGALALVGDPVGRSLLDGIADTARRQLLRHLLRRAADGAAVWFSLRCDTAVATSDLLVRIDRREGAPGFAWTALLVRERPHRPADAAGGRLPERIRMCSWCNKVIAGDGLIPIEQYVASEGVFVLPQAGEITHGICRECSARLTAGIDRAR